MKLYYLYDGAKHRARNAQGLDYTPAYLPLLARHVGAVAEPLAPDRLCDLRDDDILMVGAQPLPVIPRGRLILLGTQAAEPIPAARTKQIFAHYLHTKGRLPLFVPLQAPVQEGTVLAEAEDAHGTRHPALIQFARGYAFCFDLAATVWYTGDGYLPDTLSDYFFIGRTPDLRPLPEGESHALPFNDLLLGELETILQAMGLPLLYRLPPDENGLVPHTVISFSGDDDCPPRELNFEAAERMHALGLPYHINAMPVRGEHFAFDKTDYEALKALGCEIALHTDFTEGVPYTCESQLAEARLYRKTFGEAPQTNTNHCFIQGGTTAERLRWLEAAGILADNGKIGEFDPQHINAFDLCGFGFGTALPRYTLDDAAHQNRPISTMEIPINYYEVRVGEEEIERAKVHAYLDTAIEHGHFAQFFIHPHYLNQKNRSFPAVERALHAILDYLNCKDVRILKYTTNRQAAFWQARNTAHVEQTAHGWQITADTALLVQLPSVSGAWLLDGHLAHVQTHTVRQRTLQLVCIPAGTHTLDIQP